MHLTNIIMQQRLKGGLFSGVYHIFAVPTMPLAFHSNPVTFHQTRSWKDTCDISAYSWRFRKISCNQSRACRRPNNTWTELFSSADSKGSTRQGKAEIMSTEKHTWRDCAVKSTIKHLYITEKLSKCSWHQTCSYWTEITQNLCDPCPKVLSTDYFINIKQSIIWVNYVKECLWWRKIFSSNLCLVQTLHMYWFILHLKGHVVWLSSK